MAAPSNPTGQPKYALGNSSDGLRNVLLAHAASGHQVFPRIGVSDDLRIVLPAPAATTSAFDGLINAPSAPASTSTESSSEMKHPPYDVFINHYGKDAKHGIASSIYDKLDATGLRVFLDKNKLEPGDFFPGTLEAAMRSSSVHIAIFSENYAQSSWCLAELKFIVQLPKIKFIPIFYNVDPSTLRWSIKGKGIYGEAFNKPEMKNRYDSKMLESWRLALHHASCYTGEIISNQGEEGNAVIKVVNLVLKELKKVRIDVAKHPVGLDEAEQDFNNILLNSAAGGAQMVGIWGMGGAGKTTLAKHLFNKKSLTFGRSCFVSDVREAARKDVLYEKQKELLDDLDLDLGSKDVKNVDKGKEILKSRLKSISVLIVIDDVDQTDQLDALVPEKDSLGPGSLIIVTTRELPVLEAWGIAARYKMRTVNAAHAQQLFCWHAFGQPSPSVELEDLAEEFIEACHGLPLSLKVFGGLLCGKSDKNYWQSQFDEVSRIVPEDIKLRLRISYDALDTEEKEMFLDIACFFIGGRSSRAIAVWDGSGWNGLHGWQRLMNKCLVEEEYNVFGKYNYIIMHDHLRDLGREIANQQSPYRLWSKRQIIQIQPHQVAVQVRGMADAFGDNCCPGQGHIKLNTNQGERTLHPGSLGLKIFIGGGDFIDEQYSELSKDLVYLQWRNSRHENLPSWLSLKKLRILELRYPERLQGLWERDADAPSALKELNISGAYKLEKIENLKSLRSLEELRIDGCPRLDGLPGLGESTSLRKIVLTGCHKLQNIEGLESLKSLETLEINDCRELNALPSLAELTFLKKIELRECHNLKKIEGIETLRLLETMIIRDCREFNTLPNLAELSSLKKLELIKCYKLEIIGGLDCLRSLEMLRIEDCSELDTLPSLVQLTLLEEFKLDKFEVHACLKAPSRVNLEERELIVAVNDVSVVEPFIREIQARQREVIICTRAAIDVGSLKNFFTSFPMKNVVEFTSFGGLKLRRPENADDANAILICFIVDSLYPKLHFHIYTDTGNCFHTELASGKWVWMGVFPQGSDWLQSNRYEIWASSDDKDVKVKEAWVVMGKEGSMLQAFHHLSQS